MVPVAIGFMIGEGGNALISKKLGENKRGIANQYFSLLIYTTAVIGVVLSLAGYAFTPVIADILGANDQLKPYCVEYGRILFAAQFFYVLQNIFQSFFIAAGKPDLSLKVSLLSGGEGCEWGAKQPTVGESGDKAENAFSDFIPLAVPR